MQYKMEDITSWYSTRSFDTKILKAFWQITKPGICFLVIFTGLIGICCAPGNIHPVSAVITILCLWCGSASSAAFNMFYDRDIDAIMKRTQKRPIPQGILNAESVLEFACITGFLSVFLLCVFVNIISGFILLFSIIYYGYFYTVILKRNTMQNIVIGGAVGGFAPIIGWCAVTSTINLFPFIMFGIVFLWTPPHFWALALFNSKEDYQKVNVPMMPGIKGNIYTVKQMIFYAILLLIISIVPFFLNYSSIFYMFTSLILNLIFIMLIIRLYNNMNYKNSMKVFIYSIKYLFLLFGSLLIDHYFFL